MRLHAHASALLSAGNRLRLRRHANLKHFAVAASTCVGQIWPCKPSISPSYRPCLCAVVLLVLCACADYVSDVANGGQILLDENTFKAIKDSLSVLGTVNEAGYDDRQLQQLLHTRVVNRLQHHILCGTCACSGCK